jgi:glycosyltransferase involved in cell wall biosynthesis
MGGPKLQLSWKGNTQCHNPRQKVPVSVLVPAKNEEQNLPACLASLDCAAEVFVVDSQSEDRTQDIAHSAGAQVIQFEFNGHWPKKKIGPWKIFPSATIGY